MSYDVLISDCISNLISSYNKLKMIGNQEFINRARNVHGDKYDYEKIDYKNKRYLYLSYSWRIYTKCMYSS